MIGEKECVGVCKLKKLFFGSIGRKLGFSFGILIVLLIVMVILTYNLSRNIQKDSLQLKEVEAPLELMVEQVIGYDAILTGAAHESLLHTIEGNYEKIKEHKARYDEIGVKLDNILKIEAISLLDKSDRAEVDKEEVKEILKKLDEVNLKLVDLEAKAFEAIFANNSALAYSYIVTNEYEAYKEELSDLYNEWLALEKKVSQEYRLRVLSNTNKVRVINVYLGIIFILIALIIPFLVSRTITKPIKKLEEATEEIQKGNFKINVDIKTEDELEELGKTFNETAKKLDSLEADRKQVDKAKTEFLSITSHELRSPMTPMKAQLQMVLGGYFGKLNKEQKESLDIVLRNTERLDKIIVDFLEISRIEAARLKFNFIKTSLEEPVKRLIEEMNAFLPEKRIKLELSMGKLPEIEVDPDRVMQVLRNLINNAKKFTPDAGTVKISVRLEGEYILFSVSDNGVGIKKEAQAKIFEPFYQADNMYQHKSGGTGLGLAISKGIIESQNGRIWFNSTEGKGTTFYFSVPLEPVREIKPIRILFSNTPNTEENIRKLMIDYIGPLGEKEFEALKEKGINEQTLKNYIKELEENKILKNIEEFKKNIEDVFLGNKKRGDEMNFKEKSAISEKDLSNFVKRSEE